MPLRLKGFILVTSSALITARFIFIGKDTNVCIIASLIALVLFNLVYFNRLSLSRLIYAIFWLFIILTFIGVQYFRLHLGFQGSDFALFCQVIHNIAHFNTPASLLIRPQEVSYLEHHFAPSIFALGLLNKIFPDTKLIIVFAQSIAGLAIFWAFNEAIKKELKSLIIRSCFLMWLLTLPPIRTNIYGDFREDIIGSAAILTAIAFLNSMPKVSLAIAFSTILIKESFAPYGAVFLLFAAFQSGRSGMAKLILFMLGLLFVLWPFCYSFLQESLFGQPSFLRARLPNDFFDPEYFNIKFHWLKHALKNLGIPAFLIMITKARGTTSKDRLVTCLLLISFCQSFLPAHVNFSKFSSYYSFNFAVLTGLFFARSLSALRSRILQSLIILASIYLSANSSPKIDLFFFFNHYFMTEKSLLRKVEEYKGEFPILATRSAVSLVCDNRKTGLLSHFQDQIHKAQIVVVNLRDFGYPDKQKVDNWRKKLTPSHGVVFTEDTLEIYQRRE